MKKKLQRYFAIISLIALLIAGQSVARVVNDGGGGGSGTISSGTANNLAYYSGATTITSFASGTTRQVLTFSPTAPFFVWSAPTTTITWNIEAATGTIANSPYCRASYCLDHIYTFDQAATIRKIQAVNTFPGDIISIDVFYGPTKSGQTTSSLFRTFTSGASVTATTSPSSITINGSSTPAAGDMLWIGYSNLNSSTTQTHVDILYN